jgi:hypothetical protein
MKMGEVREIVKRIRPYVVRFDVHINENYKAEDAVLDCYFISCDVAHAVLEEKYGGTIYDWGSVFTLTFDSEKTYWGLGGGARFAAWRKWVCDELRIECEGNE